jgi:branched-chain amino acid transport system permease protein
MNSYKTYLAAGSVLFFVIFPLFVQDPYIMHILIMCLIWAAVAEAWNLIMGYAGIFSLSQIGFFVVGAYTSGMVSKLLGYSPWLGMLLGGLMAVIAGLIIGLPCLRLQGIYIALLTLAFVDSIPYVIILAEPIGSGGATGFAGIPPLSLGSFRFGVSKIPYYYTALVLSGICLYVIYRVIHSNIGLGFMGLRDSPDHAKNLGLNEYKYKLLVFGISAFLTGIMGAFYGHYTTSISKHLLGLDLFLTVIMMVEFGGAGRFPGALLGAFIITLLSEFLRAFGLWRLVILGAIVVSSIIFMPQGVIGYVDYVGRIRALVRGGIGQTGPRTSA